MSSDNEYLSENDEVQPDTVHLEDETEENNVQQVENNQKDVSEEKDDSKDKVVKPKRINRNPLPKFNEMTLRTEKGLPAVINHFKDVKFKGPGHEEQDLNRLLKTYEYWCHRFFPKYTFDDCIQRLETLGNRRSTQVYLKKIRLGMEEIFEEKIVEDKAEEEGFVEPFDDQFDQLLSTKSDQELTEEQLEQINQNRLRAEAIRRERISRVNGGTSQESTNETVKINDENEAHDEMQVDEELGIDNILEMVNEDSDSSNSEGISHVDKEHLFDKKIANAIRKNVVSGSEKEESNVIQKENSYEHEENQDNDQSDNSQMSTASSNKSATLHSSQLKKRRKSLKNNNLKTKKRKMSHSGDDLGDNQSQEFPGTNNKASTSNKDEKKLSQKSLLNNIGSSKGINGSTMENDQDSDQESISSDSSGSQTGKLKEDRRLVIDTDESD